MPATQQSQLARARLLDDVRALIADGELLLKSTAGDLSRTAAHARQRLAEMLQRAKAFVTEAQRHPVESAQLVVDKTRATVRAYPLAAVAAAGGIGLAFGFFLGRVLSRRENED